MIANIKTLGNLILLALLCILPILCNRKGGEKGKIPQLILIASPSYGVAPLLVRFEVETIPEKNAELYIFDFGDGERKLTKSKEVFHLYKKEGEFTASVSAYFDSNYPAVTTTVKIKTFDNAPFDIHIEKNQSILLPDFPSSISITVDDLEDDSVNCEINGERRKFQAGKEKEIQIKYPESERTMNVPDNFIGIITSDFIYTIYIMCEDNFGRGMTETIDFLLGKRLMYSDDYNIFVGEGKFGITDEFVILHDDIEGTKLTYYRGEDEGYEYEVRRDDLGNANVVLAKPYQGTVFLSFLNQDIISYKTYFQIGITYKGVFSFQKGIRFPVEITFPSYFPIDIEIFDRKLFLLLGKVERQKELGLPIIKIYLAWSDKITDSVRTHPNSFQLNLTEVGFSDSPLSFGFIDGGKMVKGEKSIFIMLNSSSGLIILSWDITENRLVDIFSPFKEDVFCYDMVNEKEHNLTAEEETLNLYCKDRNEKLYFVKIPVRNGKTSTDIKIYRDTSSYGEKVKRAFLVGSQKVVVETEKGKVFVTEIDGGNMKTEKLCSACTGINLFRRASDLFLTFLQNGTLYITKIIK